jgi:hypothetical protein
LVEKLVEEKRVEVVVVERPVVVVEKKEKGVLYRHIMGWYESGDERYNSKYEGEIENRFPNGQGILIFLVE